jgi:hypothetical protein
MKSHRWRSEPSTSLITKCPPNAAFLCRSQNSKPKSPPGDLVQMQRGAETNFSLVSTFIKSFKTNLPPFAALTSDRQNSRRNHKASRLVHEPDVHFRLFNSRQLVLSVFHHFSSCPKASSSSLSSCHYHFGSAWDCAGDGTIP